jgi:hypothetical protein
VSGLERQGEVALESFESLVQINLKTRRAWGRKTDFEGFWESPI